MKKKVSVSALTFKTKIHELVVTKGANLIQMNFPQGFCSPLQKDLFSESLIQQLSDSINISPNQIRSIHHDQISGKLIVDMNNLDSILNAKPKEEKMLAVQYPISVRGISICTSNLTGSKIDGQGYDFASRYFTPWNGILEDPVNGSSHTILAGFYQNIPSKKQLVGYMASPRTGVVHVEVLGNDRVMLSGNAVTTLRGEVKLT